MSKEAPRSATGIRIAGSRTFGSRYRRDIGSNLGVHGGMVWIVRDFRCVHTPAQPHCITYLCVYQRGGHLNPRVGELVDAIRRLETELEFELAKRRAEFAFTVRGRVVEFEERILQRHRKIKTG